MKNNVLIHFVLLFAILLILSFGVNSLLLRQGRSPKMNYFIEMADEAWRTGSLPRTAYNPPMIVFIILGLRAFGVASVNPYVLNFCFLAVGIVGMYRTGVVLLKNNSYAFCCVVLGLLNPYFLWSAFLAKDVSAEFMFLSLLLWISLHLLDIPEDGLRQKKYRYALGFLGSAIGLGLSRVTGFVVVATAVFLLVWRLTKGRKRKFFAVCGGIFTAFGFLFCFYNYLLVGTFTLATNGGVNLYLGNHPAYLHAHPHYDIDVFINWNFREVDISRNPAGEDFYQVFLRKTRDMIIADPLAFVYRGIRKSFWHWFGLEKIPNYSTKSTLYAQTETAWVAHLDRRINILPSLSYLIYRLFYLAAFLLSIIVLAYKKIDTRYSLLYTPLLGLWPLMVLTFPDTRFKISAEVILIPALLAACLHCRDLHRALIDTQSAGERTE